MPKWANSICNKLVIPPWCDARAVAALGVRLEALVDRQQRDSRGLRVRPDRSVHLVLFCPDKMKGLQRQSPSG